MSNSMIEFLNTLPMQLLLAWGFTKVLPMRRKPLFWVLYVGVTVFVTSIGEWFMGVWEGLALLFLADFVLPFVLYQAKPLQKAVVVVAINVCDNLVAIASMTLWSLMMQGPVPDDMGLYYDAIRLYPASFICSQVARALLLVALILLIRKFVRRRGGGAPARVGLSLAFLATQVMLMVEILCMQGMLEGSAAFFGVGVAVFAACLVVDAIFLVAMQRYERKRLEDERARLLQRQLEETLATYRSAMDDMERTARFRHDLRNQLQTVKHLAEEGEIARARTQVAAMRQRLLAADQEGKEGAQ